MSGRVYYAHSLPDRPQEKWHPLETHLRSVADMAASFADAFGSADWGRLAGMWHDLGKYRQEFQRKLRGEPVSAEHSGVGAVLALRKHKALGRPLAFSILGHHGGLPNSVDVEPRVRRNESALVGISGIPRAVTDPNLPSLPPFLGVQAAMSRTEQEGLARRQEFWTRFLFSALVDADSLDAEGFEKPEKAALRGGYATIPELRSRLDTHIDRKVAGLATEERAREVNRVRAEVLDACRDAASRPQGVFSLTVPTGGGKTLSSMSFALRHAERYNLRRVIVVLPYTSIIDQNADEYRKACGPDDVLEHHSALDPEKVEDRGEELTHRHELAAENWDAPIIVTTSVQFFESLFSHKKSRCRKLHNVARSVIILDEVQTLPGAFLYSILSGLKELAANYGCTVVLSTATPPALLRREKLLEGFEQVHPIVFDPAMLGERLERVEYRWPTKDEPPTEWPNLVRKLADHDRVLAVLHRRADARELAELLVKETGDGSVIHLSALQCPAHRLKRIKEIAGRLKGGQPCRVVSTQLVEAGVDLDFPVVYRALAGLDSIVQAAGRCNREGKLDGKGEVYVFRAPTKPPAGTLRAGLQTTESLLNEKGVTLDVTDPSIFETYFRMLYSALALDKTGIETDRVQFKFETVGEAFKLIEDEFTRTVVVPYDEGARDAVRCVQADGPNRKTLRAVQPYTVSIYPKSFDRLFRAGAIVRIREDADDLFMLSPVHGHLYDAMYGLREGDEPYADPAGLIH